MESYGQDKIALLGNTVREGEEGKQIGSPVLADDRKPPEILTFFMTGIIFFAWKN